VVPEKFLLLILPKVTWFKLCFEMVAMLNFVFAPKSQILMTSAKGTFLLSLFPFDKSYNKLLAHARQDFFQRKIVKKHTYPTPVKYEKFEDTKGVIGRCKSKKVKKHNGQKDKQ